MRTLVKYIWLVAIQCNLLLGGYIITAPNRFIPNRGESVCVSLHNLESLEPVDVTIRLAVKSRAPRHSSNVPKREEEKVVQTVQVTLQPSLNHHRECTFLTLNSDDLKNAYNAKLEVSGLQESTSYRFNDSRTLAILVYPLDDGLGFIQMDKPIYQPGQTVKFRVLYVDSRLRPILSSIDEVLVETPSGTRVSQWTQVVTHKGLGDFQLQLSDEPELGIWRISTTRRNYQVDNTFTVAEYVLPKFQVIINPPAYVTLSTPYITLEICAKYTYGEPVSGYADVSACLLENRWYYRISEKNICYFGSVELDNRDGCAYMNISRESLGYDKEGISWMGLQLAYDGYVVEKGTDVMINATRTANSFSVNDLELSIEGSDSCKPGIEYSGKVLAIYRDKALAAGKNISISLSDATYKYTKYYTSDEKGEVLFTLPPLDQKVSSLQLTAEAVDYPSTSHNFQRPSTSKNLHMWYSPSGSYLLFLTPQQKLTCNAQAELGLVYTTNRRENVSLSILVVGPADIISYSQENISLETDRRVGDGESFFSWNRSEDRSSRYRWSPPDLTNSSGQDNKDENTTNVAYFYGHLNISVGITASMFPSTSILVYYIKADGEVVADQVKVDVSYCTANKVSMEFSKRRGNPGEDVKVSLQAAPLSLCSYKVVDKSVYLKGDSEDLTQDAVANLRNYYTLGLNSGSYNDVNNYCEKKLAGSKNKLERWKRSMVISPRYFRELKDSKTAFDLAGVVVMSDLALETRPCDTITRSQYLQRFMPPVAMSTGGVAMTQRLYGERLPSLTVRDYFPETWLWDLIEIDSEGLVEVESELPHTITEWVGSAICLNEEEGLGVSPSQSVTTYQSFFTSATLPYSAIRGETIPVALSVFNYLDTCLPVQLRLKSTAEYSVEGVSTINTCVCSKDSATHTFPVVLSSIGLVNLTATATIIQNEPGLCSDNKTIDESLGGVRDAIIKGLIVEPEGAPRDYTVSEFICQSASGASQMKNIELPLPDSNLVVPDSVRASISVVGDLMGPALDNMEDLLRMPYGCGEQNMVGFSPNVFVLQYLEGQGRDSEEVRKRAVTHMQSGYQREMNYRHDDGSYSAFGPGREEGSIWLTAFVVKCFAQASAYIYIDPRLQQESIEYLESKQNSNGCFPQVGLVHSKYMQGGMGRRQDSTALTAYILISMLEAGMDASNDTVNKAWQCLFIQPLTNNYTLALVTYAMSLVDSDHPDTVTLYDQLLDAAIQDGATVSWKVSSSEEDGDGTWWYQPKSADVETTSYALLALLQMTKSDAEKVSLGLPIVKWLSQQRNSYGGFGSTQDTVIGLQALAKYASYLYTDELDVAVSVRFNDSLIPFATFLVQEENSLVQQSETMSNLAPISVISTGVGCFLFQAHVKYNVFADLLRKSAFSISIDDFASDLSNNPCKRRKLNICTRYEGGGLSTNMAVIKVSMVSGWAADPAELKSLLTNRRVQLKRYDVEKNNAVQLYFDQISRIRLCFNIEIQRVMEIDDAKPAVVTVYDYYQKELSSDAEYSILSDFCSVSDRPSTKEDLPVISWEEFENSISQARQPMLLRPPKRTLSPSIELPTTVNCPVCHKSTEEFIVSSSICDYKKAYKVSWRAKANYRLTVMANLRPSGRTKFRKRHINYALPQNCSCITLFSAVAKDKLLILGDWEKEIKNGETILINGESTVLPLTKAVEKQINTVTKQCLN